MNDDFEYLKSEQFQRTLRQLRKQISDMPGLQRAAATASRAFSEQAQRTAQEAGKSLQRSWPDLSAARERLLAVHSPVFQESIDRIASQATAAITPSMQKLSEQSSARLSQIISQNTSLGHSVTPHVVEKVLEGERIREAEAPTNEVELPPELDEDVEETFRQIPAATLQTLSDNEVKLIKSVIRYLLVAQIVSTIAVLTGLFPEMQEAWTYLSLWLTFDNRLGKLPEKLTDWAAEREAFEEEPESEDKV